MVQPEDVVAYFWTGSPWAAKITTYLSLRGLPYAHIEQPVTQPRPDLDALGVKYRRIPLIAIGRDVYADTLLITEKLDELFPDNNALSPTDATSAGLEKLLEKWTDVVVFKSAAEAIPADLPLLSDPAFVKDRTELWGRDWSAAHQDSLKKPALANLVANYDFLELLLGDGREWITGSKNISVTDIHTAWIFAWLKILPGCLPDEFFGDQKYPRTNAYIARYSAAVKAAEEKNKANVTSIKSEEALKRAFKSKDFVDTNLKVEADPTGLKEGQEVTAYPLDTGFNSKDSGKLVGLTSREVVIEKKAPNGETVRVHFPRWNFAVKAV